MPCQFGKFLGALTLKRRQRHTRTWLAEHVTRTDNLHEWMTRTETALWQFQQLHPTVALLSSRSTFSSPRPLLCLGTPAILLLNTIIPTLPTWTGCLAPNQHLPTFGGQFTKLDQIQCLGNSTLARCPAHWISSDAVATRSLPPVHNNCPP